MALLRPESLTMSTVGLPRAALSAVGIQKVKPVPWARKKLVVLRNQPYTVVSPHKGQIETRIHFAEIASKHKGEKGFKDGLPIIAYYIREEMRGYSAPSRLPKKRYPSKERRTIHTVEELRSLLK
ncbi:MAG: hypothetical protein DRP12_00170 [Candidatus Aenigmatarchaeota archaeon]|nr:MAG: hypothetical protein DRP12_00170 [Candidatus Aenigmarchaeota archaeon]